MSFLSGDQNQFGGDVGKASAATDLTTVSSRKPGWGNRWSAGARVSCSLYSSGVRGRGVFDALTLFAPSGQGELSWLTQLEDELFSRPGGIDAASVRRRR